MLEEARYNQLSSALFKRILAAADQLDPDTLEADSTGDMVTLTASSGEKCVVNTQRAVRQIWVAGKSQGLHFDFHEASGQWLDDKGKGVELLAWVSEVVQEISGNPLSY